MSAESVRSLNEFAGPKHPGLIGGEVADSNSSDPKVKGVRRMNELIAQDSRLSATAIQTVGSKGHDGFALLRVNSL